MGMSIDRAIKKLKGQQADFNEQYIDFGGINDAFNTAYEVMRKYQKIVEIVDKWNEGIYDDEGLSHTEVMELVSDEVYEDGNDD